MTRLFAGVLALSLAACTGGRAPQEAVTASDDGTAPPAAASATAAKGVEVDGKVGLGKIENDDLRKMIHDELERRVTRTSAVGDGAEEAVELGTGETFQYTVVKLSRGLDDVSGDPAESPDGLEVEVNGWYKKTLAQKDAGDPAVSCMSFDTYAKVVKHGAKWSVPDDYQVVFNREDQEDCY